MMSEISTSRRKFLTDGIAITGALGVVLGSGKPIEAAAFPAQPIQPQDEASWKLIAKNYNVTQKITNLENG